MINTMRKQFTAEIPSVTTLSLGHSGRSSRSNLLSSMPAVIVLTVLFLLFFVLLIDQIFRPGYFTIEKIHIEGHQQRIDPRVIEGAAWRHVNGNYFSVDLSAIEKHLKEIPGLYAVAIRRVWPSTLNISVTESAGLAKWSTLASDLSLATTKLVNLPPHRMFSLVPELLGPDRSFQMVLNTYLEADQLLWPLGLDITKVHLTRSEDWMFNIQGSQFSASSSFFLVVGRDDPITKIDDFVDVFELALRSQVDSIESIDLRYPNGLAVRWKSFGDDNLSQNDL